MKRAIFQPTLNNFANSELFLTKVSGIDTYENLGGHVWRNFFMVCVKLVAMAIYEVKQACGNDNVPPVYLLLVYAKYSTFLSMYLCQDCLSIEEDYKGPCQGLASNSILTEANDNG